MDSYKIKKFKTCNIDKALELWRSIPEIYLHQNGEDTHEGIKQFLKRNKGFSFLAFHDKEIVGAMLCGHDGRRGLVHHLAVKENYRKQGIGREMMNKAFESLKKNGIKKCALFVLKNNQAAYDFYIKNGWKEEDIVFTFSKIVN